jgi:hypothetical protein
MLLRREPNDRCRAWYDDLGLLDGLSVLTDINHTPQVSEQLQQLTEANTTAMFLAQATLTASQKKKNYESYVRDSRCFDISRSFFWMPMGLQTRSALQQFLTYVLLEMPAEFCNTGIYSTKVIDGWLNAYNAWAPSRKPSTARCLFCQLVLFSDAFLSQSYNRALSIASLVSEVMLRSTLS